eukprot:gene29010-35015_t
MDQLRQALPALVAQLRSQQENAGKLSEDAGKLAKIHRAMYVRRILDITASLMKQGGEVARIVADVRGVQRDINMASDALGRADAVCEEVIYKVH